MLSISASLALKDHFAMNDQFDELLLSVGCNRSVINHCKKVADATEKFSHHSFINQEMVRTGAAVHDIGRGKTHSLAHAQMGADLCREIGLPESISRIVECHIGAGITSDECTLSRLLPRDCVPTTIEEKIVAHADNTVQGSLILAVPDNIIATSSLSRKIRKRIYRLSMDMHYFWIDAISY
jgi:uncharacterized protein